MIALGVSPETYRRPWRTALAGEVVRSARSVFVGFTLLSAIASLVVIRIVLVTAQSYGLSQYALQMVVRVLVLELIPLAAAVAVAVQVTVPAAAEMAVARASGRLDALRSAGGDPLRGEIAPRALAGLFLVPLLAVASGVVALVLAYLLAHGFSPWGLERFTRLVGQVFVPSVAMVFALKTVALAIAVAVLPIASALHDTRRDASGAGLELQGLLRMFVAVLAVETLALAGSYL